MSLAHLGGWWRFWIVITVIYAVIVIAVTWQSFPSIESTPYSDLHLRGLSDRSLEILAGRTQPPISENATKLKGDPLVLEMANGAKFVVLGNTPKEQTIELAKDYARVLNSAVQESRYATVQSAFLWWFLPSMSLLLFGWTLRWVYRGFKQ